MSSKLGRSTKWTTISTIINSGLVLLQLSILTRFFESEIFGQFAVINLFVEIFTAFATGGISSYLIYRKDLTAEQRSTVFWLAALFGVGCFLLFNLLSPVLLKLYGYPELGQPLLIMSILFITSAISSQYQAIALKNFEHAVLAKLEIACRIIAFSVAMMTIKLGLYCLVVSALTYSLLRFLGCLILFSRKANFTATWDGTIGKDAARYGVYAVGGQMMNITRRQLDSIILAGTLSISDFGIYHVIKQLASRPAKSIQPIINRIALPALGHVRDSIQQSKAMYEGFFLLLSATLAVVYIPLIIAAEPIVSVVYGDKYVDHHMILSLLATFWLIRVAGATLIGPVTQSSGRTKYGFVWNACLLPLSAVVMTISSQYGIFTVCVSLIALQAILFPLSQVMLVRRIIPVSVTRLIASLVVPCVVLSAVALLALWLLPTHIGFQATGLAIIWIGILGIALKTSNPITQTANSLKNAIQ
ncbi:oligosaccharide flippase family protein [Echinimonas agarilytica]|uniref:Oligosaccharide flippase family protein n=1 Tax=Echinimonas agarilytica TaxID=1215918 RepID=A0AA41WA05_9GAMM|nr:oligosaccharide flippase family protein [Echinimonas agarilytica]MCM2681480.1 oligosaccharide flippase family protein [Echinimonas agarilytica]